MTNSKNSSSSVPATTNADPTPAELLKQAIDKDLDVDKLERLVALQERWQANQARRWYSWRITQA